MKTITSRSNPLVAEFKELADSPGREGGRLLLDGVHLVREAQSAGLSFDCVAVSIAALEGDGEAGKLARSLESAQHEVVAVSEPVLRALSPVQTPSGIVAIARRAAAGEPMLASSADVLFLVVSDVQDPGNLGALIRIAEAGGAAGVVVCGASAHPYGWRALRGSMGSALRVPITQFRDIAEALAALKATDTRVIAAVPKDGNEPDTLTWTGRVAICVGGEGSGLAQNIIDQATELVTIPMTSPVESLNVAAAGAILIYAAGRQRVAHPAS